MLTYGKFEPFRWTTLARENPDWGLAEAATTARECKISIRNVQTRSTTLFWVAPKVVRGLQLMEHIRNENNEEVACGQLNTLMSAWEHRRRKTCRNRPMFGRV